MIKTSINMGESQPKGSFSLYFINGQSVEIHLTAGEDQQLSDEFVHVIILFIDYCEM